MLLEIITFILILIALYLLAIMPKLRHNKNIHCMEGWLYAHRGIHDNTSDAPENSLKAFALAVENGFGIELDVQLTKDLIPVILHDYNLMRSCGTDKKVSSLTYEELQEYHLFESVEKIPTLKEVLELVNGKVPLIVELKIVWKADKICTIVNELLKGYSGFYVIESFNPFGLMWYRRYAPKVIRGQLSTDFKREMTDGDPLQYFLLKHLLTNFLTKPDFIAFHHVYKNALSFTLCRKLYHTMPVAWTIQTQEQLQDCRKYYKLFIFDGFLPKERC